MILPWVLRRSLPTQPRSRQAPRPVKRPAPRLYPQGFPKEPFDPVRFPRTADRFVPDGDGCRLEGSCPDFPGLPRPPDGHRALPSSRLMGGLPVRGLPRPGSGEAESVAPVRLPRATGLCRHEKRSRDVPDPGAMAEVSRSRLESEQEGYSAGRRPLDPQSPDEVHARRYRPVEWVPTPAPGGMMTANPRRRPSCPHHEPSSPLPPRISPIRPEGRPGSAGYANDPRTRNAHRSRPTGSKARCSRKGPARGARRAIGRGTSEGRVASPSRARAGGPGRRSQAPIPPRRSDRPVAAGGMIRGPVRSSSSSSELPTRPREFTTGSHAHRTRRRGAPTTP